MQQKLFTLFLLLSFYSFTFGQSLFSGSVLDVETGKALTGVTVSVEGSDQKVETNHLGYFQVSADTTDYVVFEKQFYKPGKIKVPGQAQAMIALEKRIEPEYEGGIQMLYKYVAKAVLYPRSARSIQAQGCVYLSFQIDSLGTMHDVTVIEDQVGGCGDQIKKLLESAPGKWAPAEYDVTFILPVRYVLERAPVPCRLTPIPPGVLLSEIRVVGWEATR